MENPKFELSIVMPCLNEAETIAHCVRQAHQGAREAGLQGYEIIIADNGSQDGSQAIAREEGAIVVDIPVRGYGAALRGGIKYARGKYVLMGDADASYDFSAIRPFVERLRKGCHLVMGTRLKGDIKTGAMPFLHRYLGSPVITFLGNLFFGSRLSDFNCGMRAFDRDSIQALGLRAEGMEFASEMIIKATTAGLTVCEVPIAYFPDGRTRPPHLRTWRDGWRHLRFLLLYTPRWLLFYPGLLLSFLGLIFSTILFTGPHRVGAIVFDVHTLLITATTLIVGIQLVFLAIFSRAYVSRVGLLPLSPRLERLLESFSLGMGLIAGIVLLILGLVLNGIGVIIWNRYSFGPLLEYQGTMRIVIAGTTLMILGIQTFFSSFVLSLLSFR